MIPAVSNLSGEALYVIGVVAMLISLYIIAALPWIFWCWHFLLHCCFSSYKICFPKSPTWSTFMLQFMRVLSLCVLLYPVLYIGLIALLPTLLPAIAWGPILFRVVFSLASGPLALSALAFRHGFVFNSVNYWALWTVHIGPALSVFGMRWYGAQVETYFPGVFFTGIRTANPLLDDKWFETFVVIPACLLVFVYAMALAYAASYFSDADRQKVSDDHVYTPYDSALIAKLETLHPFRGQLVFLATYLFLGCASFLITPLLWSSLSIHVFYLLAITLVCIQNGAKYYLTVCPRENWGSGHRAAILEMEDLLFPSRMQPPRAILPNAALENRAQTAIFLSLPLNNVIRKQDYEWRMAAISKGAVVVPRRAPAGSDVYGHERVPMPPKSSRAHKSQRNPISSTSSETRESSAMAARS